MDDSVCILKIDHDKYADTYKTGFYKLRGNTLYFSDISAGFHYITELEFTRSENLNDDSLEIELFIAAPAGSGWTQLDSMKFVVNGLEYQAQLIPPTREDINKRSHFIKVKRPLSRQIMLSAYAQDSTLMIYKPMYFLNDLCLHNSYINKLYVKMVTFLNTEGDEIPLSKLLPESAVINSKVYKVRPGK